MVKVMSPAVWLWCARISWALLPATAGTALADATAGWDTAPARVAALFMWFAWAGGLLALLVPRPWGTTVLRIVAPLGVVAVCCSVTSTSTVAAIVGIVGSVVAAVFALSPPVAVLAANALAYGEEVRFPLRVPTPLLFGPIPIALAIIGLTIVSVLVLAGGAVFLGVIGTAVGALLSLVAVRALHPMARRWAVLVPAGIAIVDPMTLIDPVLVRREAIANLHLVPGATVPGALDLRLGAIKGGVELELSDEVTFGRRRGRINAKLVAPAAVVVAVVGAPAFATLAGSRGIEVS
jgi:hypothetical protein